MSLIRLLRINTRTSLWLKNGLTRLKLRHTYSKLWITLGSMCTKRHVPKQPIRQNVFDLSHIFNSTLYLGFMCNLNMGMLNMKLTYTYEQARH